MARVGRYVGKELINSGTATPLLMLKLARGETEGIDLPLPQSLSLSISEPVWPSGKALGW